MTNPQRYYKYRAMDKHASSLLSRGVMYFNIPSKLNDPFELWPVLDCAYTQESWRKAIFSEVHDLHPNWSAFEIATEVERRSIDEFPPSSAQLDAFCKDYKDRLDAVGIFSMNARWDSIVMWSHYAAEHTGFCVELNPNVLPPEFQIHPVVYLKHRPRINIFAARDSANKVAALSKNEEWRYEDEWRMMLGPPAGLKFPHEIDFPEGFITGVILGAKMKKNDKTRVLDWVGQLTPTVDTYEAYCDKEDYRIGRNPCDR